MTYNGNHNRPVSVEGVVPTLVLKALSVWVSGSSPSSEVMSDTLKALSTHFASKSLQSSKSSCGGRSSFHCHNNTACTSAATSASVTSSTSHPVLSSE